MNIAVIAANGRTGQAFVELALAAGHNIRAGVYHTNNLPEHEHLSIVQCDARNSADLTKLIEGQEAVVSFIGHVRNSPAQVQTDAMKALAKVMQQEGLKRIVSLTGTGVRFPQDKISLIDRILNLSISLIDPKIIKDGRDHVLFLQQSNLEWTVIRVLKLQNTSPKPFSLTLYGPTKWWVSREDVAKASLQVLSDHSFIKQAPIISKFNLLK